MITAAAIYAPTASDDARTPLQVAEDIYAACGADLTPAGWATFIAESEADVEAVRTVATVKDHMVRLANGRIVITLAA